MHLAAADLLRICSDKGEAARYFAVADRAAIEENEFNLNLPRYVDTFEPEETIDLETAVEALKAANTYADQTASEFAQIIGKVRA